MEQTNPKKLYVKTWGCQMNDYDSARMADVLAPHGYAPVSAPDDADLIILNTCHIREKSSEKLFSELGRMQEIQKNAGTEGRRVTLAVTGCVAQAEGAEIAARAPYVGLIAGSQSYQHLPRLIEETLASGQTALHTEFPVEDKFAALPPVGSGSLQPKSGQASAFLAVQEGCDKFCTFCVVPYTRGGEYSRPASAVLEEARRLVDRGVKEIILLGQNVNAWHGTGLNGGGAWGLEKLLLAIAELAGVERLRYTTSHPRDMSDELIAAHGTIPQLMPFLHLPVQSGSDRILDLMNRKHDCALYLDIVAKLRKARPDIALSSDFIVGFPGESDADFESTLNLIRTAKFAQAYSFKYSPRHGTPAALSDEQVEEPIKTERLTRLQTLLWEQQYAFNISKVGTVIPVLFERSGKREKQIQGRSPWMQSVYVTASPEWIGHVGHVHVTACGQISLRGEIIENPESLNLSSNMPMSLIGLKGAQRS